MRARLSAFAARGAVAGEWIDGEARVLDEAGMTRVNELLDRKYGEAMAQFKQRNNLQYVAWDAIEIRV
jgi:ATP-dependent DNA ligase